jgi:hypothetical protein
MQELWKSTSIKRNYLLQISLPLCGKFAEHLGKSVVHGLIVLDGLVVKNRTALPSPNLYSVVLYLTFHRMWFSWENV